MRTFQKIFCIGLNKTGTSSLHHAFGILGLRSIHHAPNEEYVSRVGYVAAADRIEAAIRGAFRNGEPLLAAIDDYDAYSDIRAIEEYFPELDRQYPGSKFIYTDRDTDSWIASRARHVEGNRADAVRGLYSGSFVNIDPEGWRREKERHWQRVEAHFRARPEDLLVMRITAGDGFEPLCRFLGLEVPGTAFPWRNRAVDQRHREELTPPE